MKETTHNSLANKIILVTGASDGIGKEATLHFAKHGATVIMLGRRVRSLEKIYDEIMQANYTEPFILPMNLTQANPDHYQEIAARITEEFGRLDGLLHNAAEVNRLTPIELYDIQQWYSVMQTNLHAPFLLTQTLLSLLKKSSSASLVFTLADDAQINKAYWGAYSVSKVGLHSLMKILSQELENTHIRVNAINPGPTRTKLRANTYPGENSKQHPLPDILMPIYLYLMSDESRAENGKIFEGQLKVKEINIT